MGGLFQLFRGRGGDFQELGHRPLFGLWWLASELSWHWWVGHLSSVLQGACDEAQGPLAVEYSAILDLVGSSQFLSCPMAMSFF